MTEIQIKEHAGFLVVRDDLIPGGTKARVIAALFDSRREYVYASPVQGFAQIALAHAARAAGKEATIFCAARKARHARTQEAAAAGARIVEQSPGYLSVAAKRARDYCAVSGARLLPFGLDCPEIVSAIAALARALPVYPAEVWSVAGSGVLTRGLQAAWPEARFFAVRIGASPNAGRATLITAPERYEDAARVMPPFPSCVNYDAKAWRFMQERAAPGALFWNVAA